MRILLVTDHYPPFIGGAQRQVQMLATQLAARGHHVGVATVWHKHADEAATSGVDVHHVRQLRTALPRKLLREGQRHQPPWPDPVSVMQLRRLINSFEPDLVHSYGWISFSCAAALLGSEIPLMISARDYAYSCATRTLLHKGAVCSGPEWKKCVGCAGEYYGRSRGLLAATGVFVSRPLLRRRVDAVHSISRYVQEVVRRDFVESGRRRRSMVEFIVPSFGPELELGSATHDVRPYMSLLPSEPFILYVGAFRKAKGLEVLFDAYAGLDDPPPLVLIGTRDRDCPPIPSDVLALESFPHRAVMAAWERALFGVFPSLWPEPLGSVVYEAMSCGRPVIGTTPGGQSDMVANRETGILVPAGDATALRVAIAELIGDRSLRDRYGAEGRRRSEAFRADRVIPEFEKAYRSVIAARATVP
jgi:glycosyltransferase involved in cell wall biosynthesis